MTKVWKDILRPGTYRLKNGRVVKFTTEDTANGLAQGKAMIAAGLNIPVALEHQSHATPEYLSDIRWTDQQKADFVRNTVGHISDYRLAPGGVLEACHEFRTPEDAEIAAKARFVSPRIDEDAVDSKGRVWAGKTVSHVAVTPVPVQDGQSAFNLSAAPGTGWTAKASDVLSRYEGDMADGRNDTEATDRQSPGVEQSARTSPPTTATLKEFVELLNQCGVNVGDDVTDLDDLRSRLKGVAANVTEKDDGMSALAGDGAKDTIRDGANPPCLMSALDKREAVLVNAERKDLARRADALFASNRIDGPNHRKLKADLATVILSFTDSGDIADCKLVTRIEAYEALPAGQFAKKDAASAELSTLAPPAEFEPKKDAQDKARDWLVGK